MFHFFFSFSFFLFFSSTHVVLSLSPPPLLFSFSPSFKNILIALILSSFIFVPKTVQMGQMASVFCLLLFSFIVMTWLILKLCFWVCILIIWLCLSLEMFERKIVAFVAVRGEGKNFFIIEMYEFFKYKNSFQVVTVFSVSREALWQLQKIFRRVLCLDMLLEHEQWAFFSKK